MDALDLARWQFGITTVYHFLFVPLSIGMALFVAITQTLWHRTDNVTYLRMTKFWGKLLLINFALGVVTGIVQEFQFGMNWSDYSRFVGDIFGAPLAMEGLIAFFLESTFLGLWIFGWDRLPRRIHLACIWLVAFGTTISAAFILAANSWMQHPVGFRINEVAGRAELTSFWEVLTNSTLLIAFPHTILAAWMTAGMLVLAVSAWHLLRRNELDVFTRSARIGLVFVFAAGVLTAFTGHTQAQIMTEQQPMKMAAAEALWDTEQPAGFSIFAVGDIENGRNSINIVIPHALSVLSTNTWDGTVEGINDLQALYEEQFGPGNYIPNVGVVYWSFRIMVGAGFAMIALSGIGLWLMYRNRLETTSWYLKLTIPALALPFVANSAGWIMTEMGRQPWVVWGVLRTEDGVSPNVGAAFVWVSMIGFTLLYGVLAGANVYLLRKYA
ncbi:MAG TPA: cytochrome ubiquinol oxidase subunit I, partial [Acidimicrobiales bacterium]|nr:cytochrome ubiquinol oxidase subunit I [Acidimicrobiales bacterium]